MPGGAVGLEGLVLLKSNPDTWIFTSFVVGPVLWCGTDSIRYVTLHFRDRRYTASLRYRNRAEITVLVCEQKPYPVLFSCRFKSCLGEWEKSLSWLFPVSYWIDHYPVYQRFFSRAAGIFGVGRSHERRSREKKRETALEKVSGTQGDRSLASERYIVMSTKCLATNFLDQLNRFWWGHSRKGYLQNKNWTLNAIKLRLFDCSLWSLLILVP